MLNQVLKVSAFFTDAGCQALTPFVNCVTSERLFQPCHTSISRCFRSVMYEPSSGKFAIALCPWSCNRLDSDLGYYVAADLAKISNIIGFSNFTMYCILCCMHIENFLPNQLVKEFWKSVNICQSYQTWSGF